MTAVEVLGSVDELADGTAGSVDAATGAAIGPYRKSRLKASRHTQGRTSASRLVLPALHITAAEHTNRAFVITSEVTNRISRSTRPWHPAGKSMCRSEPNATRLRVREELRGRSHNELVRKTRRCLLNHSARRHGHGVVDEPLDRRGRETRLWATANALHGAIFHLRLPIGSALLVRNLELNSSPDSS
jgi:hypothetical protein